MQFHAAELIRWEAEPEHQDYLERYPHGYTCHYVRPDWKLPASKVEQVRTSGARTRLLRLFHNPGYVPALSEGLGRNFDCVS